ANLGNRWALALVKMDKHVSTADIAGREGGTVEEVQGRNVTLSRRNSYIANVAPDAFGVMSPATRPTLVRWLKSVAANKQPVVSEFLQAAIEPADARPPFLLALDLTDALDPQVVKFGLKTSAVMAGKADRIDAVTRLISNMKGVKMGVRVTDTIRGELRLEFGERVGTFAELIKPLVLEILDHFGMALEGLGDWEGAADGNSFVMK